MVDFVSGEARRRWRTIGLVPELKHSTYFASFEMPLENRLLRAKFGRLQASG